MLTDQMIQSIIQIVCGLPEDDGGQRGQFIGTLVHGILLEENVAFLYSTACVHNDKSNLM